MDDSDHGVQYEPIQLNHAQMQGSATDRSTKYESNLDTPESPTMLRPTMFTNPNIDFIFIISSTLSRYLVTTCTLKACRQAPRVTTSISVSLPSERFPACAEISSKTPLRSWDVQ